ncbi:MAG: EAL domain-containing protein [Betaproteobacteria bacterium]|nr:EAL domain-containing protein [Betaproteobacteria bacterium]
MDTLLRSFHPDSHPAIIGEDEAGDVIAPAITEGHGRFHWVFQRTAPYLGALGAIAVAIVLLATIYFTWFSLQWVAFLSGILIAAVLSIASRSAKAEWMVANRTAQLTLIRDKLAQETRLRTRAETAFAGASKSAAFLDDLLPAMLAHVDTAQNIAYHNRAFRLWSGLSASHVEGYHLRDVVGSTLYANLESDIAQALAGQEVHNEHRQLSAAGEASRLLVQCLPQFDQDGGVCGVFLLMTDITRPQDVAPVPAPSPAPVQEIDRHEQEKVARCGTSAAELTQWDGDTRQLRKALAQDEFCLYSQSIKPLQTPSGQRRLYEILLRLNEEEDGLMPPGYFLHLAEQHGMLPELDRWVVRNLLGWISRDEPRQTATYSINIAKETIADAGFPDFVARSLREHRISGTTLCFEFQEADLLIQPEMAAAFAGELKRHGCRSAICGFGGNRLSFEILQHFVPDYIKIDGGLVLNMLRSPADLARVKAINAVAHEAGIAAIAECVEDRNTIEKLSSLQVDYAQGFGISRPRRLQDLDAAGTPPVGTLTAREAALRAQLHSLRRAA